MNAIKFYYHIWKKEERDIWDLDNEEFISKLFEMLWDLINLNNCYGITDIVLFFHNIGNYHKQLRSKNMVHSKLDDIKGIGEIKKKLLLEEFKTIKNIKNASVEELCKIKGINEELAKNIKISL